MCTQYTMVQSTYSTQQSTLCTEHYSSILLYTEYGTGSILLYTEYCCTGSTVFCCAVLLFTEYVLLCVVHLVLCILYYSVDILYILYILYRGTTVYNIQQSTV